ncbi:hypothetical protein HK102_000465 [Quaeritorhiza haematococci]|nr:hypothetical protein HK102_000465 [Quaeritorhiza haematococci]
MEVIATSAPLGVGKFMALALQNVVYDADTPFGKIGPFRLGFDIPAVLEAVEDEEEKEEGLVDTEPQPVGTILMYEPASGLDREVEDVDVEDFVDVFRSEIVSPA